MHIPGLDPQKLYIPFDQNEIGRTTKGKVTTIALDLEIKRPTPRKTRNYREVSAEWGFYEPVLLREATVALAGIRKAGYMISDSGALTDAAMRSRASEADISAMPGRDKGGIDFSLDQDLHIQNSGHGIIFNIDPLKLKRLQDCPGFVPVIVHIQPMNDLRAFLGLKSPQDVPKAV